MDCCLFVKVQIAAICLQLKAHEDAFTYKHERFLPKLDTFG